MNRKTRKMLLTGKKPRHTANRVREKWTIEWPDHTAMINAELNNSAIRAAFDQLREIMFQALGVPAHLVR